MKTAKSYLIPYSKGTGKESFWPAVRAVRFPRLSKGEWAASITAGMAAAVFAGETLYGNMFRGFLFLPAVFYFPWIWERRRKQERHDERLTQFLDGMEAFSSAMEAGYSAENAVSQSRREMGMVYGEQSFIYLKFREMEGMLSTNRPLEAAFKGFAVETGLKEAEEMADIIRVVKQNGGDMAGTLLHGVKLSRERKRLSEEIRTLLSGKRYEGKIMKAMPVLVLWMMRLTSPGFLQPMYENLFGNVIMTGCAVLYGAAWIWEERIFRVCT